MAPEFFRYGPMPLYAAQPDRVQGALGGHADRVVLRRRPAAVHADEVFLARELELDRRAGLACEHRGDEIGVLVLVLVAEVAAHVLADDADLVRRDPQVAGRVGRQLEMPPVGV